MERNFQLVPLVAFRQSNRLATCVIGAIVLLASLGLGEVVYRLMFLDFDGATDRFPLEVLFGVALALLSTGLAERHYRQHKQTTKKLHLIRNKNHRIRHALGAISPSAHPYRNQQSIRVIQEEVDFIDRTLKEVLPSQAA